MPVEPECQKIWHNADLDPTSDNVYTVIDPVTASTWDHNIGKVGSTWYVFAAPDNGTQFIDMYTSASLTGTWTKQQLTNPGASMWDYWPEFYLDNAAGYLFYTSEKDGYGHIALESL